MKQHLCSMQEDFELPITYKGQELALPASFLRAGYSYKIQVDINGQPVLFEPDEERNWRAIIEEETMGRQKIDAGMIQAVIQSLDHFLK